MAPNGAERRRTPPNGAEWRRKLDGRRPRRPGHKVNEPAGERQRDSADIGATFCHNYRPGIRLTSSAGRPISRRARRGERPAAGRPAGQECAPGDNYSRHWANLFIGRRALENPEVRWARARRGPAPAPAPESRARLARAGLQLGGRAGGAHTQTAQPQSQPQSASQSQAQSRSRPRLATGERAAAGRALCKVIKRFSSEQTMPAARLRS